MKEISLMDQLRKPFPVNAVHWRPGAVTKDKTKTIALAYVDARDVMKRLDDVCGMDWQCRYPFAGCCEIGISRTIVVSENPGTIMEVNKIEKTDWIWRSNGAGTSDIEAEKGQFSDAFKRAAVMWGVGRYLYYLPNVWVEIDQYKKIIKPPELPPWATPEGFLKSLENKA